MNKKEMKKILRTCITTLREDISDKADIVAIIIQNSDSDDSGYRVDFQVNDPTRDKSNKPLSSNRNNTQEAKE